MDIADFSSGTDSFEDFPSEVFDNDTRASEDTAKFFVVGIGASAGGLEALEQFFQNAPNDIGMAFIVVQHLSPEYRSMMSELLGRKTRMPVETATDGQQVEPNHIYLMPPKCEMIIAQGRLLLSERSPRSELLLPIDRFFSSLARDCGVHSIGVILSGTGSDGSRGITEIHQAGGLVISQDCESAKFDGMPTRAQETGAVDLVMSPALIPNALIEHLHRRSGEELQSNLSVSQNLEGVEKVLQLLKNAHKLDFADYKSRTVVRRIERRLMLTNSGDMDGYISRLEHDKAELEALYRDLLIGVTRFFRDTDVFRYLETDVLPTLLSRVPANGDIRIWSAACATGEEPYSLAMLLAEQMDELDYPIQPKIFATDVHRTSLEAAALGHYAENRMANVSPERLKRFFTRVNDGFRVSQDLRRMIIFAPHNVVKDAPFTNLDLIVCRNMLIYLNSPAQKRALSLFHFGLKHDGRLLLGRSESPGSADDEFQVVDGHCRVYRKGRITKDVPTLKEPGRSKSTVGALPAAVSPVAFERRLITLYDRLLETHMPPSLLFNERHELVHAFSGAGQYLHTPDGRATNDVIDMLCPELRSVVSSGLLRVREDGGPVVYHGVKTDSGSQLCVTINQIIQRNVDGVFWLAIFESIGDSAPDSERVSRDYNPTLVLQDRIKSLEEELRYNKEVLQTTVEELEAGNEEQQATNEELIATNEELQSTNEELHSVNEELFSVNSEHQRKISELTELTDDLDNLFQSTQIGTIFLDRELRVRKFTPAINDLFHLLPQDIGRRINTFTHTIAHDSLLADIERVLDTELPMEAEVHDHRKNWFLLRILPYRHANIVAGVVLTLIDIQNLKQVESELRMKEQEAREAVIHRDRFLAMLSHELRNPLGAIQNASFVLEKLPRLPNKAAEACSVVRRQVKQVSRLLDDLLDVSRITQRKIEIKEILFNLIESVRDAVDSVRAQFKERGVRLVVDTPAEPIFMLGDPTRIQQINVNLLANASKYTPANGEVRLSVCKDGTDLVISVKDNGIGIPQYMLERVFELFAQSDHSLDRAEGGMGVGLTLVRSIVEMHGGTVRVTSEGPGKGSEFVVRLPSAPAPPEIESSCPRPKTIHRRIVVVEDNPDSREMLRTLLEMDGHTVNVAADGAKGLELIQQEKPDVALIDIGLPQLNGYEVATQLRENPKNRLTKLIALTGYGRIPDRELAKQAGFDAHLVKPLDKDALIATLDSFNKENGHVVGQCATQT